MPLKKLYAPKVFLLFLYCHEMSSLLHQNLPALVISNPSSSCLKGIVGSLRQSKPFICYTNHLHYFVIGEES